MDKNLLSKSNFCLIKIEKGELSTGILFVVFKCLFWIVNQNPLHVAAGLGDLKKVKNLLKQKNHINSRDHFGATPLLVAMVSGKEEIVNFLLSRNANRLISAKDGYSLIHAAAFSGKKSLVQKALSFDLDVNSRYGPEGITPIDVADETGDALPYLRSLGGKTAWELGRVIKFKMP